jgi:alpha-glutamyl/putrescinyl thymine pyrophosphorylase clade 1
MARAKSCVSSTAINRDSVLGLDFPGLFGRPLQPIDCQNLFCEISKYARVAHPEVGGVANRTRIKQSYHPSGQPAPQVAPNSDAAREIVALVENINNQQRAAA